MKRLPAAALAALACLLLAACAGGPVRRVSEPAASIQQLTVHADGSWAVALRIDNFSSIPMRFDAVDLAMTVDGVAAGTLRGTAGITIVVPTTTELAQNVSASSSVSHSGSGTSASITVRP